MGSPAYWREKRVLITGITGFVGSWLSEKLLGYDSEVYGLSRTAKTANPGSPSKLNGGPTIFSSDITKLDSVVRAFRKIEPEIVFHLAAESSVAESFRYPLRTYEVNVSGTANVLEAARLCEVDAMHFAGSSEEYGVVGKSGLPVTEKTPLRPVSPYAASKVAGDFMCYAHYNAYGTPIVRTRAFNHTGVRRSEGMVTSTIARQAAEIKAGIRSSFLLGNLDAKRDFSDVRDIIEGYMLAVEKGRKGETYVLCSGKATSIKELVRLVCNIAGIKEKIEQDSGKMRVSDIPVLRGSFSKAKRELGWRPRIKLESTLRWMFEWQEERVLQRLKNP